MTDWTLLPTARAPTGAESRTVDYVDARFCLYPTYQCNRLQGRETEGHGVPRAAGPDHNASERSYYPDRFTGELHVVGERQGIVCMGVVQGVVVQRGLFSRLSLTTSVISCL